MSKTNFHFDISERKILLRFFDIIFVFIILYFVDLFLDFHYFNISKSNFYWTIVLGLYINVIGSVFEMYNLQIASNQFQIIKSIVLTTSVTVLFYLLTPFFTPILPLNRLQIVYFYFAILSALLFWRIFYQKFIASYRFEKRVVLICDSNQLDVHIKDLASADPHYRIVGFVCSENKDFDLGISQIEKIEIADVEAYVKNNKISEIVVSSQKTETITILLYNQLLSLLEAGFSIKKYTQVYESLTQRLPIDHFGKDFYLYFPFSRSNQNRFYLLIVKFLELILSLIGVLIGIAIIPFIYFGNLFFNRGSLFYMQERVGQNGRIFKIFKFRTMFAAAESDKAIFATQNDPRVTKFGKILRKSRIDEFPQFINILKGDMSFIGPRPERPFFVLELSKEIPFYDTRHVIKPGLTGWAQVNYTYGESANDSLIKLQYDLYYIKHRSVFLDLNIVIKTCSTVIFYRGQ